MRHSLHLHDCQSTNPALRRLHYEAHGNCMGLSVCCCCDVPSLDRSACDQLFPQEEGEARRRGQEFGDEWSGFECLLAIIRMISVLSRLNHFAASRFSLPLQSLLVCKSPWFESSLVCGPSGVGKTTLIKQLMKDYPDRFGFSISHTSRPKRVSEVDGVHFYRISSF